MKYLFEEMQILTEEDFIDSKYYVVTTQMKKVSGPYDSAFDAEEAKRKSSIQGGQVMQGDDIKSEIQFKSLD